MTTPILEHQAVDASPERIELANQPTMRTAPTARVLHVINGEHYAGAERVQDLLAAQLPNFGFGVGFACVKRGRFSNARTSRSVPLFEAPMQWRFDLRPAWRIAEMIRDGGYGLVHTHTPRSALIGALAARRAGVPFVHHVHSPTARDTTHRLRDWLNARSERFSIRRAARLIAVSPSLRNHVIANGFPSEQVTYVANGVPGVAFDATRCGPKDAWTLGMVALVRPRKGIEVLLEALAKRREAGDNVRLRVVGPFETQAYEDRIQGLVHQLHLSGAVEWTGFTDDVHAELAKIDLFVLPSLFGEGLPMVVLEAMAAGLPTVATDVEGIPVAVRDGKEGALVVPNDADSLAVGIARFTRGDLDWATLRKQAYLRHAEQFSDRAMAEGVAKVYGEVLA